MLRVAVLAGAVDRRELFAQPVDGGFAGDEEKVLERLGPRVAVPHQRGEVRRLFRRRVGRGEDPVEVREAAGGLEFTPDPRRPFRRPIRLGVRYAQLPFPLTPGEQPTEFGITLGSGFSFAQDRAVLALALERAWRDQSDAYSETAWIVTAGVTVRP